MFYFFFFKQKTAYEMRISDWSSDVCSSDLLLSCPRELPLQGYPGRSEYGAPYLSPPLGHAVLRQRHSTVLTRRSVDDPCRRDSSSRIRISAGAYFPEQDGETCPQRARSDRKRTRLNSSH